MTRRLRSERGAELIEFALIFPLLLLVLLGIIDFGFLFQRYEVLTNATREGARMAVLPGYSTGDVQARVCDYLLTGGVPAPDCAGANPTPSWILVDNQSISLGAGVTPMSGRRVRINYAHNYMFIGPIVRLMGGTWTDANTIHTSAIMRLEIQPTATP